MNTTDTEEKSQNDLKQLAHQLIADKIGAGEIVGMNWAAQELIRMSGCAREHACRAVTEAMDNYGRPESADRLLKHAKEIEEYVAKRAAGTGQRKEMAE